LNREKWEKNRDKKWEGTKSKLDKEDNVKLKDTLEKLMRAKEEGQKLSQLIAELTRVDSLIAQESKNLTTKHKINRPTIQKEPGTFKMALGPLGQQSQKQKEEMIK
jgi:hypothetical protein